MIHPLSDVQSKNIGENTNVWQFCVVLPDAVIGDNCNICSHCFIENDVKIGNNVTIKYGVAIHNKTEIEDDVFVGPNAVIVHDRVPVSRNTNAKIEKTILKKGCILGGNVTILPGITIGENAIVGAGSVVTKNVEPNTVVTGNPAKFLKMIAICCICNSLFQFCLVQ